MAIQTINIGNVVNDGLGDDLRTAFQKVNANFAELNASLTVTAANTGGTGYGVFKEKVGAELRFRKLVPDGFISIDGSNPDTLVIGSTQPVAFTSFKTDGDTLEAFDETDITIEGGTNITVDGDGTSGVISIDTKLNLSQILVNYDFGFLSALQNNPVQLALQASNIDFGTITNPGSLDVDAGAIA